MQMKGGFPAAACAWTKQGFQRPEMPWFVTRSYPVPKTQHKGCTFLQPTVHQPKKWSGPGEEAEGLPVNARFPLLQQKCYIIRRCERYKGKNRRWGAGDRDGMRYSHSCPSNQSHGRQDWLRMHRAPTVYQSQCEALETKWRVEEVSAVVVGEINLRDFRKKMNHVEKDKETGAAGRAGRGDPSAESSLKKQRMD